ncbi:MAG TPA: hypothetical protein VF021_06295 [Longimicrobiales bacterium]
MMLGNGQATPFSPDLATGFDEFAASLLGSVQRGARVVAYFRARVQDTPLLVTVLGWDEHGRLEVLAAHAAGDVPALREVVPALAPFERAIAMASLHGAPEQQHVFVPPADAIVHEVAVGPVHAGVIEPGHFRFHCVGETVLNLEILLGYQKRGAEAMLLSASPARRLASAQEIAGDSTVAHTTAYCQLIEALSGTRVSIRAHAIRAVALELERMANHVGDIGALAGDIGYQPTAALCGRLRGAVLNVTAQLCGNRFGRWLLTPGGVRVDVLEPTAQQMLARLDPAVEQFLSAAERFLDTPGVLHRLEGTAKLATETAALLGLVGVAARASGLPRDVRQDYPFGCYALHQVPIANASDGDVFARALVRRIEAGRARDFVSEMLRQLPEGEIARPVEPLRPRVLAASLVEGWRGEVAHVAITDGAGRLAHYSIVDPSRHNWSAVSAAMSGQQISDFPLTNKSFNLSYAGHDL